MKSSKKYINSDIHKKKFNILEFLNKNEKSLKIFIIIILSLLSTLIIKSNKSSIKVAMCTIAKKENRYIKYFVEFYKNLGYDHIYFYDNNDPGDESISDLQIVKEGIKEGFITIIIYNNIKYPVTKSYYDCYEKYSKYYDWISFIDIDEYLILKPNNSTIQEFLGNPRLNDCDLVKFNWRVFTDNDQLDWIDEPLMKRFPIETNYKHENRHVKSIIRGGLNYSLYKKNYSPHSIYNGIKACSSSGIKTGNRYYFWPPDFKFAYLNHYVTKSVREFFYKKYKTKVNVDTIPEKKKKNLFNYFFKVNKKTKKKVDIFNAIYHTKYK